MELGEGRPVVPPLKWAGGKRWLVANHSYLFSHPFERYIEPFLGSGAVYFALKPNQAILSDKNEELINFYQVLRDEPASLHKWLRRHAASHCKEYYYRVRSSRPKSPVTRAAKFLYLNRTCWNGLYRENIKGEFNVPVGTKTDVLLKTDDFERLSALLASSEIRHSDFEPVLAKATVGDFVFIDPPYTVAHNNNGFVKYNQKIFSWDDQVRLAECVTKAADRGAVIVVTNACHDSVARLYRGFRQTVIARAGVIAGLSHARKKYEEVVIQCP